jgi:general secretion pathway protein E
VNTPARPGFAFARRHGATVAGWESGRARVLHRPGVAPEVFAELRRHCQAPLQLEALPAADYERRLAELYGESDDARTLAIDPGAPGLAGLAEHLPEPQDLMESQDDAPIIRLLNALFAEAVRNGASDIHVEPFESRLAVRMRIDGQLREVLSPDKAVGRAMVSRIKVMARLDIAEKRLPQDGRISLRIAGRPVDVRVGTIPVGAEGERVVMRLLDKQAGRLALDGLGLPTTLLAEIEALLQQPHGVLLVTGPTGAGKTTTLYAALQRLNQPNRSVLTVEDPIEYLLDGIGQTQVNPRLELDFARGLRAILRQDPDVVMVGEIRDRETAQIAVQASLTGHLVLSTLHANTAVGAVTRLRDMGIEPFLLASSLRGVLAQRLVRLLDPQTSEEYTPTPAECALFGQPWDASLRFRRPRADTDRDGGYRGRTGLYELVVADEAFRRLVHDEAGEHDLLQQARTRTPSLVADAWAKVRAGLTSVEEVQRVMRED